MALSGDSKLDVELHTRCLQDWKETQAQNKEGAGHNGEAKTQMKPSKGKKKGTGVEPQDEEEERKEARSRDNVSWTMRGCVSGLGVLVMTSKKRC